MFIVNVMHVYGHEYSLPPNKKALALACSNRALFGKPLISEWRDELFMLKDGAMLPCQNQAMQWCCVGFRNYNTCTPSHCHSKSHIILRLKMPMSSCVCSSDDSKCPKKVIMAMTYMPDYCTSA